MPILRDNNSFSSDIIYGSFQSEDYVNKTTDVTISGEPGKVVKLDSSGKLNARAITIAPLETANFQDNDKFIFLKDEDKSIKGTTADDMRGALDTMSKPEIRSYVSTAISGLGGGNSSQNRTELTNDDLFFLQFLL